MANHAAGRSATPAEDERLSWGLLDVARGLLALEIALLHAFYFSGTPRWAGRTVGSLLYAGYLNPDAFFMISALVLFLPVVRRQGAQRPGEWSAFAVKRVFRIYPAYLLVLAFVMVGEPLLSPGRAPLPGQPGGWPLLLQHVTMQQQTFRAGPDGTWLGYGSAGTIWTLTAESWFYLLLPFVAGWFYRRPVRGLMTGIAITATTELIADRWTAMGGLPLIGRGDALRPFRIDLLPTAFAAQFATGMFLAWLIAGPHAHRVRERLRLVAAQLTLVGLVSWLAVAGMEGHQWYAVGESTTDVVYLHMRTRLTIIVVPVALTLLGLVNLSGRPARFLHRPALVRLGEWSLTFYLVHFPLLCLARQTLGTAPDGSASSAAVCFGAVALSLPLAALLHVALERPLREYGRRVARRMLRHRLAIVTSRAGALPSTSRTAAAALVPTARSPIDDAQAHEAAGRLAA